MQVKTLNTVFETTLINVKLNQRNLFNKIRSRLPWESWGFDYDNVKAKIQNPDFLYIRRTIVDREFLKFLKYIKEKYKECKIIIEIYTYPYDKDDFNRNIKHFIWHLPFYLKDVKNRKKLKQYVDRLVTFSKDDIIFGINTIKSVNGINVEEINIKKTSVAKERTINLISVAHMQEHHGYERLIRGIKAYNDNGGDWNIYYHIVGDGKELKKYNKLIEKYNLQKNIIVHGKMYGTELDELYDIADIGVSSLGLYKYKIDCISSIKTSEYLAKGLLVISGCRVSTIDDVKYDEYICEFPNDSSSIDIYKLIDFYKKSNITNKKELPEEIREFAYKYFDMKYALHEVICYISGRNYE